MGEIQAVDFKEVLLLIHLFYHIQTEFLRWRRYRKMHYSII